MAMAKAADADRPTSSDTPRCVVDRTVHIKLPFSVNDGARRHESPRSTPSAGDGVAPSVERLHRVHGTSILLDAATLLRLPPSAYATSCAIFHRAYHRLSLRRHCVWSLAAASALLASKVEERPRAHRAVILAFSHVYRRRRLRIGDDVGKYSYGAADCEADGVESLSDEEKENTIRSVKPMPLGGPVYAEWKDVLFDTESLILRTLGFTLHWIPDSHPHRFILYFIRVLDIESKEVAQKAWNYCNDSCHLDLCVRYSPEVIACSAILMASSCYCIKLPLSPKPWWELFIGSDGNEDLSAVCNAILAVGDENDLDIRRAKYAFVSSLRDEPSFNDPESYLWSVAD